MRAYAKSMVVAGVLIVSAGTMPTFGAVSVSASVQINAVADFHQPLVTHGTWVEVGSYGSCWRPASVAVGWRPYAYGSWVWTDYGWYWESDEPWAWACYHYGNWVYDPGFGWVWIPGIAWSPAWVSWRTGGGYWGWAPLPPRGVVIAPRTFVFVESRHFHEPIRPNTVIVNNTTILNRTTEIKNVRREINVSDPQVAPAAKVVINEGPKRDEVEKATGAKVREMAVRDIPRGQRNRPDTKSLDNPAPTKPEGALVPAKPTPPNRPTSPDKSVVSPKKPTPPDKPTPPEKPTPPDQPVPPAKPTPPNQPTPPAKPVPPDQPGKPAPVPDQDQPALDKPAPPIPPSEQSKQKPKRDRKSHDRDKNDHPR